MTIGELCNRDVVVTTQEETLEDAAKRMRMCHVGDLVVVEEREGQRIPIGILTDRDIVLSVVALNAARIPTLVVGDVMSCELVTGHTRESVASALKRMQAHGVRRLPIVDEAGALIGIVTADDIIRFLSEELSDVVKLIGHERAHEQQYRM